MPQKLANFGVTAALSSSYSSQVAASQSNELHLVGDGEHFDQDWEEKDKKLLVVYSAQDGLGMRTNRHFYPLKSELVFVDGLSHVEETAVRHQKRLMKWQEGLVSTYKSFPFQEAKYQPYQAQDSTSYTIETNQLDAQRATSKESTIQEKVEPIDDKNQVYVRKNQTDKADQIKVQGHFFISHELYKCQIQAFDNANFGMASVNTMQNSPDFRSTQEFKDDNLDTSLNIVGLQITKEKFKDNSLDSNRVQMGIKENVELKNEQSSSEFRPIQPLSSLYDLTSLVQMPIEAIEREEEVQIVETMLEKIALQLHNSNYQRFKAIFGETFSENNPNLSSHFFTVDPIGGNGHPTTHLGKLLSSVKAKNIDKLGKHDNGYAFFFQTVEISPQAIVINQQMQLEVIQRELKIINRDSSESMLINDIFVSTPEVVIFPTKDQVQYPIVLGPGQSHTVTVLLIPETLGLIQGCVHLLFQNEFVFMAPISVFVIKNAYGLEPFYYTGVNLHQKITTPIKITNANSEPIEISEAYSTEEFLSLYWPEEKQNQKATENSLDQLKSNPVDHAKDLSKLLSVGPKQTKTLFKAVFETSELVDHSAMVHLLTSDGHVFRVPLYYHVYADNFTFVPSIADFGIVSLNFDSLVIPVTVEIRQSSKLKKAKLASVFYPIDDSRVQFLTGDWAKFEEGQDNLKEMNAKMDIQVNRNKKLLLFHIILKPDKYGLVESTVKITFKGNESISIDYPIKGIVVPMANTLVDSNTSNFLRQINRYSSHLLPFLPPNPALDIDISKNLTKMGEKESKSKDNSIQSEQVILKNFFKIQLKNISFVSLPDNFAISYNSQDHIEELNSKKTIQFAQISFDKTNLGTFQGRKYFFLKANDTLIPQYVQLESYKLLVTVQEDYQLERFSENLAYINLNFGKVGMYQQKERRVKISNLSQKSVFMTWANKTQPGDEMSVLYEEDNQSQNVKTQNQFAEEFSFKNKNLYDNENPILDRFIDKKRVGIFILPGRSIILKFLLEGTIASLASGRASSVLNNQVKFQFQPSKFRTITISYSYQFVPGKAYFNENMVHINHLIGANESGFDLNLSSVFEIPLLISSIESSDSRFTLETGSSIVEPFSKHEFRLTFSPYRLEKMAHRNYTFKVSAKDSKETLQIVENIDFYDFEISEEQQLNGNVDGSRESISDTKSKKSETYERNVQQFLEKVTNHDIMLWRQRNKNQFTNHKPAALKTQFENQAQVQNMEAQILVKTNIQSELRVAVQATIQEPLISKIKVLSFGGVQLGVTYSSPLEFVNPFNQTLHFSLFLGKDVQALQSEENFEQSNLAIDSYLNQGNHSKEELDFINKIVLQFEFNRAKYPSMTSACEEYIHEFVQSFRNSKQEDLFGSDKEFIAFELYIHHNNLKTICVKYFYLINSIEDSVHGEQWQSIEQFFEKLERKKELKKMDDMINGSQNQTKIWSDNESTFYDIILQNYPLQFQEKNQIQSDLNISQDIQACSYREPLTDYLNPNQFSLNFLLAFPNPFKYGSLKYILENFSLQGQLRHVVNFKLWIDEQRNIDQSWYQISGQLMSSLVNSSSKFFQNSVLTYKQRGLASSTYLQKEVFQRDLDSQKFQPAAALTHSWELSEVSLHKEILAKNGTYRSEINQQHFFINPAYRERVFSIEPGKSLMLPQVILFEPHTFSSTTNPTQMTLFVKSDQTLLQTVDLVGHASTTLLDIYKVNKRVLTAKNDDQKVVLIDSTNISSYKMRCDEDNEDDASNQYKQTNQIKDCVSEEQSRAMIEQQVLGRSTLTSQLNLRVNKSDLFLGQQSQDNDMVQRSYLVSFIGQISQFLTHIYAQSTIGQESAEFGKVNNVFVWEIFLHNMSPLRFWATSVYLEDPISGQQFCTDGSLTLNNCQERDFFQQDNLPIKLKYVSDFTVTQIKRNLVIKSIHMQQRFEIYINIEPEVIRVAQMSDFENYLHKNQEQAQNNSFKNSASSAQNVRLALEKMSYFMLWVSLIIIGYHLGLKWYEPRILPTSFDKRVSDSESSLTGFVRESSNIKFVNESTHKVRKLIDRVASEKHLDEFMRSQDKFLQKRMQFQRDCFTMSQKKNSVTLQYQRSLAIVASAHTKSLERASRLFHSQSVDSDEFLQKRGRQDSPETKNCTSPIGVDRGNQSFVSSRLAMSTKPDITPKSTKLKQKVSKKLKQQAKSKKKLEIDSRCFKDTDDDEKTGLGASLDKNNVNIVNHDVSVSSSAEAEEEDITTTDELLRRAFADRKQCFKDSQSQALVKNNNLASKCSEKSKIGQNTQQSTVGKKNFSFQQDSCSKNDSFIDVKQSKSAIQRQNESRVFEKEQVENNLISELDFFKDSSQNDLSESKISETDNQIASYSSKKGSKNAKVGIARLSKKDAKKYEARKARSEALAKNSRLVQLAKQAEQERRALQEEKNLLTNQHQQFQDEPLMTQKTTSIGYQETSSQLVEKEQNSCQYEAQIFAPQQKKLLYEDQILQQNYYWQGQTEKRSTSQRQQQITRIPAVEEAAHQLLNTKSPSQSDLQQLDKNNFVQLEQETEKLNSANKMATRTELPDISIIEPRSRCGAEAGGIDDDRNMISKNYWNTSFKEQTSCYPLNNPTPTSTSNEQEPPFNQLDDNGLSTTKLNNNVDDDCHYGDRQQDLEGTDLDGDQADDDDLIVDDIQEEEEEGEVFIADQHPDKDDLEADDRYLRAKTAANPDVYIQQTTPPLPLVSPYSQSTSHYPQNYTKEKQAGPRRYVSKSNYDSFNNYNSSHASFERFKYVPKQERGTLNGVGDPPAHSQQVDQSAGNFGRSPKFQNNQQVYVPKQQNKRVVWHQQKQLSQQDYHASESRVDDQYQKQFQHVEADSTFKEDIGQNGYDNDERYKPYQEDVNDAWNEFSGRNSQQNSQNKYSKDLNSESPFYGSSNQYQRYRQGSNGKFQSHHESRNRNSHNSNWGEEKYSKNDQYETISPQKSYDLSQRQYEGETQANQIIQGNFYNSRKADLQLDRHRNVQYQGHSYQQKQSTQVINNSQYQVKQTDSSNFWDAQAVKGNFRNDQQKNWRQNQQKFAKMRQGNYSQDPNFSEVYKAKSSQNKKINDQERNEDSHNYNEDKIRENQSFQNQDKYSYKSNSFIRNHNPDFEANSLQINKGNVKTEQNSQNFQSELEKFDKKLLNYRTSSAQIDQKPNQTGQFKEFKPQDAQSFAIEQNLVNSPSNQSNQMQYASYQTGYLQNPQSVKINLKERLMKQAEHQRQLFQMGQINQNHVQQFDSSHGQQASSYSHENYPMQFAAQESQRTKIPLNTQTLFEEIKFDNQTWPGERNPDLGNSQAQKMTFAEKLTKFATSDLDDQISLGQRQEKQSKFVGNLRQSSENLLCQSEQQEVSNLILQTQNSPSFNEQYLTQKQTTLSSQQNQDQVARGENYHQQLQNQYQDTSSIQQESPQKSKNFLSVFKSLKNIFSNVPNQEYSNSSHPETSQTTQGFGSSLSTPKFGLFGQPQLDNFYAEEYQPAQATTYKQKIPQQQFLNVIGASQMESTPIERSFYLDDSKNQAINQQPAQILQKQPSTLESLRQDSKPLLISQQTADLPNFYDQYPYDATTPNTNFANSAGQTKSNASVQNEHFAQNSSSSQQNTNNFKWKSLSPYQNPISEEFQQKKRKSVENYMQKI